MIGRITLKSCTEATNPSKISTVEYKQNNKHQLMTNIGQQTQ
jgi:hypothetical protein